MHTVSSSSLVTWLRNSCIPLKDYVASLFWLRPIFPRDLNFFNTFFVSEKK